MPVGPGSSWTAASMYTHHAGMPAFSKVKVMIFFKAQETPFNDKCKR